MTYHIEVTSPGGRPVVISRSNVRAKRISTLTQVDDTSHSGENVINDVNEEEMETKNVEINNIENKENEDQQIHTDNEAEVPSEESKTEDDEATSNNTSNIYDDGIEITFQDDILDDKKDENPNEFFEDDALVDQQIIDTVEATEEDYEFQNIKGHHWNDGVLMFTVQLASGKIFDVPFALLKRIGRLKRLCTSNT